MKFEAFYKKMIEEMSSPFSSYVNPGLSLEEKWKEDKDYAQDFFDYKNKHGDVIHVKNSHNDRNIFFFFVNSSLRALIQYEPLQNNGIKIKETLKAGEYGLYMSEIFKDFLLSFFSYILSDNYHTKEGISVYKRLVKEQDLVVLVLNIKTQQETLITNPQDIDSYYGVDKSEFVFKVSKKYE